LLFLFKRTQALQQAASLCDQFVGDDEQLRRNGERRAPLAVLRQLFKRR